jgi:hypothetical protein
MPIEGKITTSPYRERWTPRLSGNVLDLDTATSTDTAFFVKSDQDLAPCAGDLARTRHHRDGYTVATVTLGAVQSLIRGAQ